MENNYPLEVIPAAAISSTIKDASALILDTLGNSLSAGFLKKLYSHSEKKVYYTRPGINQVAKIAKITEELGIKTIILCSDKIPALSKVLPVKPYSACVISAGSASSGTDIAKTIAESENITDFSHLAYQKYRTDPSYLRKISNRFNEELRLGILRGNLSMAEPVIRNKEYIFIDLKAVRISDFPNNPNQSPNGLYAEELCQLARYTGMGQKVKTTFIYGIPCDLKANPVAGELAAEVVWHITEALAANIQEDPSDKNKEEHFLKKIVSMGEEGQDITFVTSHSSGRWWVEVPVIKTYENVHVPCSYTDYLTARSGDVPMRWLFFFQKLNPI